MTDTTTHLRNDLDAPLVDAEFIANKHRSAFVCATAVLNAENGLPAEVQDAADLERLAKHVKDAKSATDALELARKGEKARFDEAGKQVQGIFTPRIGKLDATKAVALARINAYNRRVEEEQRQRAKEAADRERAEAQRRMEAAANIETAGMADVAETILDSALDSQHAAEKLDRVSTGSAADLVRAQTAAGTVTSATILTFEIVDGDTLRAALGGLGPFLAQPDIEKAIRAYVAHGKKQGKTAATLAGLAGVRFFEDRSARVR